jgi:hypothetical protein
MGPRPQLQAPCHAHLHRMRATALDASVSFRDTVANLDVRLTSGSMMQSLA